MKDIGIYVHIPFCKSKCNYCDFTSFQNKDNKISEYIACLKKEIESKSDDEYFVKTIYIGGGTPSYINSQYIEEILQTIETSFKVYEKCEISIEVNPGSADEKKLEEYFNSGINRLSIGMQSGNDNILKTIGRIHTYSDFKTTVINAKKVGFTNLNADIIIGLPNQTIYDVENTIDSLLELDLKHISVYSLIVEENTKLEKMLNNKELKLPDEEIERYMYWFAKRKLEGKGYNHYEISNFAKPGYCSKHNLDCWNQKEYLGFGVSASSYENAVRYTNTNCIETYIRNILENNNYKNIKIEEKQDKQAKMNEYMMLGLRKISGVSINEFRTKFDRNPIQLYKEILTKLLQENLIIVDTNCIKLSKKGIDLANLVWEEFV